MREGERERDKHRDRARDEIGREPERERGRSRLRNQQWRERHLDGDRYSQVERGSGRRISRHPAGDNHRDDQRRYDTELQEGQWTQVRGRRKARAKEGNGIGGGQHRQNASKYDHSRGSFNLATWRSRPDVTSFYFAHFPNHICEKDLWKIFQEWGKVWEIFISKTRNKQGFRYSFVRFKGEENEDSLERQLDNNIFIEGMKLFVNKPKFQRGGIKEVRTLAGIVNRAGMKRREYETRRQDPIPHPKLKSYVEVLKDNHKEEAKTTHEPMIGTEDAAVKTDSIVIHTNKQNTGWLEIYGWGV